MSLLSIFCFKQKTAYELRISDWSSDVCSSDLPLHTIADSNDVIMWHVLGMFAPSFATGWLIKKYGDLNVILAGALASLDRKSVVSGKSVSVRVDLGGRRIMKKKRKSTYAHSNNARDDKANAQQA